MILPSDCAQVFEDESFSSDSLNAVIRVYDDAGNVVETHAGQFKEWSRPRGPSRLLLFAKFLKARIVPERVEVGVEMQNRGR